MIYRVHAIRPLSVAPVLAVLSFLAGCLTLVVVLGSAAVAPGPVSSVTLSGPLQLSFRGMPPLAVLLAWPFLCAVWGALIGVLCAWAYNVVVRVTGPVQLDLRE